MPITNMKYTHQQPSRKEKNVAKEHGTNEADVDLLHNYVLVLL